MFFSFLLEQVGQSGTIPASAETAVWIALITGICGVVTGLGGAILNNKRSNRHSAEIEDLRKQLKAVKTQFRQERLTWHAWARKVVAYLRSLPNGQEIANGLPPMPDSIKRGAIPRVFRPRSKTNNTNNTGPK